MNYFAIIVQYTASNDLVFLMETKEVVGRIERGSGVGKGAGGRKLKLAFNERGEA